MTILPKRRVGRTKLEVTTLGLGGAPMGGFRATIPDAEAMALTEAAWQAGQALPSWDHQVALFATAIDGQS